MQEQAQTQFASRLRVDMPISATHLQHTANTTKDPFTTT